MRAVPERSRRTSPILVAKRRASRRGRPPGSFVRLLDDPHRFEVAALFAARALGYRPYPAATTVAAVFSPSPIRVEVVNGMLKLSTAVANASLKGRAGHLKRRADLAMQRANPAETTWVIDSAAAIEALVRANGDPHISSIAIVQLQALGWSTTLATLAWRLRAAFEADPVPTEGILPRRAHKLAQALSI